MSSYSMKKHDWKLQLSFIVLLSFLLVVGGIGYFHIKSLTKKIERLASFDLQKQRAVAGLKSANSLYAMGVRNYVSWRFSGYLEAAKIAVSYSDLKEILSEFDRNLKIYSDLTVSEKEKSSVETLAAMHVSFRKIGDDIISAVDLAPKEGDSASRTNISRLLVAFDNEAYKVNKFIDEVVSAASLAAIKDQITDTKVSSSLRIKYLIWSLGICVFLGGQIAFVVYRDKRKESERDKQIAKNMIALEERERQNLSFQIHNQMGQDLSALKIYLGLIENKSGSIEEVGQSKEILLRLIDTMHNISELLCPPGLKDVGLVPMIHSLIRHYKKFLNADFIFNGDVGDIVIGEEYALTLYRVAQESLNNTVKYSKADRVEITIKTVNDKIELTIKDNGVGFNYKEFIQRRLSADIYGSGLGILRLKERVQMLEGEMRIYSEESRGVEIEVVVPYKSVE